MSWITNVARLLARRRLARLRVLAIDPKRAQLRELRRLLQRGASTAFGLDHGLGEVRTIAEYQRAVPLRDYGGLAPYWDRARLGQSSVAWPGFIEHYAISSGTTSGEKFLPVSRETIGTNKKGGFDSLVPFLAQDSSDLFGGKLLFLGGSTALRREGRVWIGDNTGIMTRAIPPWMRRFHTPGQSVATLSDWEEKIERTVAISIDQDVRMLSGVPSWLTLFAERVLELASRAGRTATKLIDLWPNLALIVHGGMSFGPYRQRLLDLVGRDIWCVDTYSASEGGMLAVQDRRDEYDMLPLVDQGVFLEFVEPAEIDAERPTRRALHEVEPDRDYAVCLTTDSGI